MRFRCLRAVTSNRETAYREIELRIILSHDQQRDQRAGSSAREFLECGGIVQHFGRGLNTAPWRAALVTPQQHILFPAAQGPSPRLTRLAPDRAALVLIHHFRPARLDAARHWSESRCSRQLVRLSAAPTARSKICASNFSCRGCSANVSERSCRVSPHTLPYPFLRLIALAYQSPN